MTRVTALAAMATRTIHAYDAALEAGTLFPPDPNKRVLTVTNICDPDDPEKQYRVTTAFLPETDSIMAVNVECEDEDLRRAIVDRINPTLANILRSLPLALVSMDGSSDGHEVAVTMTIRMWATNIPISVRWSCAAPEDHIMEIFLTGIVDDLNQFVIKAMRFNAEVDLSEDLVVDIMDRVGALALCDSEPFVRMIAGSFSARTDTIRVRFGSQSMTITMPRRDEVLSTIFGVPPRRLLETPGTRRIKI